MNRQGSQYTTSYHSTYGSTNYNRTSRPHPAPTNGTATSLIKSINSGSMNLSTANNRRTASPSRLSQTSSERPIRPRIQRRQPSLDRSVSFC
jgi:hypothetical protein